jgi:hypothetical protein
MPRRSLWPGLSLAIGSVALWAFSAWLRAASGSSAALVRPVRPGEVVGAAGELLATAAFVAGLALVAIEIHRRRRDRWRRILAHMRTGDGGAADDGPVREVDRPTRLG